MSSLMKRRPSPALVLAIAALFVALSSTATAALLITGTNIKDGTVTGRDIKRHTLGTKKLTRKAVSALKGEPGPAGPAGPQGPRGAAGAQGATGPKGDTGFARITVRPAVITFTANGASGEVKHAAAMCMPGETVVGGGYRLPDTQTSSGPVFAVLTSLPASVSGNPLIAGQDPRGWYVEVVQSEDVVGGLVITVLCASP